MKEMRQYTCIDETRITYKEAHKCDTTLHYCINIVGAFIMNSELKIP